MDTGTNQSRAQSTDDSSTTCLQYENGEHGLRKGNLSFLNGAFCKRKFKYLSHVYCPSIKQIRYIYLVCGQDNISFFYKRNQISEAKTRNTII